MNKRLLCFAGGVAFAFAGTAFPQSTQTTTTVTTQKTETVRNADGTYSVIEYPADKETMVEFTPNSMMPGARGTARVMRSGSETTINVDVSGLTGDATGYNLYAVDPMGAVTMLGPLTVANGTGTLNAKTPLDKFMLFVSPESNLTNMDANTPVLLRSAVPQGMAVVPVAHSGESDGAGIRERVAATTTAETPATRVPMLGIQSFRKDTDTHMNVKFAGELTGVQARAFIKPRTDGSTWVKMRFFDMKKAQAGKRYALYAVSPTNEFVRMGQVINTGQQDEEKIEGSTALKDFGLFVTVEEADAPMPQSPGTVVGTLISVK